MTSLTQNQFWGPDLSGVRGNILKKKPSMMDTVEYMTNPEYFYKIHKFVMLVADVMFDNVNTLIITSARKLNS